MTSSALGVASKPLWVTTKQSGTIVVFASFDGAGMRAGIASWGDYSPISTEINRREPPVLRRNPYVLRRADKKNAALVAKGGVEESDLRLLLRHFFVRPIGFLRLPLIGRVVYE
ncbi:MAG: hypothetical protein ACR2P7_08245 [bacterium]